MSGENEPITREWLRSVGFQYAMIWPIVDIPTVWNGRCFLAISLRDGHAATTISDGDVVEYVPAGLCPKTRGDVVLLCVAMGFREALTAEALPAETRGA